MVNDLKLTKLGAVLVDSPAASALPDLITSTVLNPLGIKLAATATVPLTSTELTHSANSLSGGKQQILAFARGALSRSPKVLIADELSLGLAPAVVERLAIALAAVASQRVGVLVVEQHVHTALESRTAPTCCNEERSSSRAGQICFLRTSTRSNTAILGSNSLYRP
jgi:ABC-type branched-subunit amino acid transport system ATPase component